MTPECSRVMDRLGEMLPPELESHVATCADCRAMTGGFDLMGAPGKLSHPLAREVLAPSTERLASEGASLDAAHSFAYEALARRPRARPWWHELLLLLGVHGAIAMTALAVLAHGAWVANRADVPVIVGVGLLLTALLSSGAYVALAPHRRTVPWGGVIAVMLSVGATVVLSGSGVRTAPLMAGILGCAGTELAVTAVPLAFTLVLLCRSAYHPVRALAAGLSAGGVSLLVLHLHCADGTTPHLLAGHVVPWLALGGITLLLRALLPTRSHAP
ncbi:DUF1109 domain-containing protein [Myxococcus sp. MISCRS1]|uniref:DUF1109 domain-containing protein n=1 Tax=unclassified Myxococcus TaxID=2648731 RepID=UPI001CC16916|nr:MULTISPECIES: DUF1109 domain-containing protein [unclassified Myxococcus]MBZ4395938.1 DUF1109 domain-containing protein [Myxococcus sp. AS-1-15]MBZ4408955.1 DUF1109 domain-containing protein [Myxococcus sp. XM-1-1-1]MCY1001017.1 DUF1109 domain-containing protein [Myxococcus sp. MISCRS1]BDT37426.1 DUF1109 domain-containing protein [Myxococcus sp. MH1]